MKSSRQAAQLLAILLAAASNAQPAVNALWVYSVGGLLNPVTDTQTRQTLIQNSAGSAVNMIYVSVYSSITNSQGRLLYNETSIAALITAAHTNDIEVYAASGDPDWPALGCAASANPSKRLADIAGYNTANPSARFDGVILDVEPGSNPDFQQLLTLYQCQKQQAAAAGLGLAAAINAFWNAPATYNSVTKPAYELIVDLGLNNLVVMGYRNYAGTLDCKQGEGIVCLDEGIVGYANSTSRAGMILAGINTDNPATSNDNADETFYSSGESAMNSAAQSVVTQFAAINQTFGGFAVNNYRDSYLSGQANWPATNPNPASPAPGFSAASVTNAASYAAGSIAPGELITIFGVNLGPAAAQTLPEAGGRVTTDPGGVQVMFDGIAAPVTLASSGQVNAIVPFELTAGSTATIQLEYAGGKSGSVDIPVSAAAPGIFTADSSGRGPIAALNQDLSANSASNPALPGSIVILYLTGAGQTSPAGIDGLIHSSGDVLPTPVSSVAAAIAGLPATVLYAGDSVGIVSGVIQVNLLVPSGAPSGRQSVTVQLGGASTQEGVTIAIR